MLIKTIPVGNLEANCHIVIDEATLKCALVDPGDESNVIMDYIEANNLKPEALFLTHGHYDHVRAADDISEETGATIYIHEKEVSPPGKNEFFRYTTHEGVKYYKNGDIIKVGGLTFGVMETPGHSPGSVTLICENVLFTGDTLFKDSCGRTDLEGGNMDQLMASLRKLGSLEENYEVYPGHMESTTLDIERGSNYYLRYAMGLI